MAKLSKTLISNKLNNKSISPLIQDLADSSVNIESLDFTNNSNFGLDPTVCLP